jgi:hypothetical protein
MLLIGILIFAYQKEIIILNIGSPLSTHDLAKTSQKKNISFFYWLNDELHTEQIQLIFSDAITTNMQHLVHRWLQLLHEEKITRKKTQLQTATLNFDQQELLLSFDRFPWNKEHSTFEKWMIIETLLKTIKLAEPSIKRVRFLINQQPILDTHLDFTNPWPINGFSA